MPELPEVETIRRQLAPALTGRMIERVVIDDARLCAPVAVGEVEQALSGLTIDAVGRRGKYLLIGCKEVTLVLHLRMTGSLLYLPARRPERAEDVRQPHQRALIALAGGDRVVLSDPRRFATAMVTADAASLDDYLDARLGPEPFSDLFTPALMHEMTRRRRTPIKAVLLEQRTVAGVGNIYADEALFRAALAPHKRAARLTKTETQRLHAAVRAALTAGIDAKGASIDDFRDVYGARGAYQNEFLVHRRAGAPCPRCGAEIVKRKLAGRGTYHCPGCQRA